MPTTLKDIALEFNLSVVTISKVLRDHPDVSPETRDRVLRRMKELNYRPPRPQSFASAGSEIPSGWSFVFVPVPARCRAAAEYRQLCCAQFHVRGLTTRPGSADGPNRSSLRPFLLPRPRSHRSCAVVPVRASRCRHTSERSVFDARATKVSGVTIAATSARSFRPNPFAFAASGRRWSSLRRNRRPPSCSRRTRFSSRR